MNKILDAYKAYWTNWKDFSGKTNLEGYWYAIVGCIVAGIVVGIVVGILSKISLGLGTAVNCIYALATLIPGISITIRRLKDAGYPWQHIFFALIPIAGAIILILKLVKPSVDAQPAATTDAK